MAVNRFYNASRGSYQSMFIPEELPTDLMLNALGQKQKQYDIADVAMISLGDWNQRALQGYDTKYVKGWKGEIENFVNQWQGKDLTSAEFQRQYRDFNKKFKSDEGLKKVQAAVEKDDAFWLRYNALKQDKDTYAAADELANDYLTRRGKYTADTGYGFTGDIQLGDENIKTGNDIDALAKKLYDDIHSSGGDSIKQFENFSYKTGYEGVSQKTLDDRTMQMLDHFIQGPGGNQLIERYNMERFGTEVPSIQLQNMSKEDKEKYNVDSKNYVLNYLKQASGEFKWGKTTSNLDEAKNKQHEENKSVIQQPNIEVDGLSVDRGEANFDNTFTSVDGKPTLYNTYTTNVKTAQHNVNSYGDVIKSVSSGKPIKFTPEQQSMLQGLPGGVNFMNGKGITAEEKNGILKFLNNAQTAQMVVLQDNETRLKEIENNYATTADIVTNGAKYNGLSYKEAHENITEIENDPNMKQILALYSTIKEKNPNKALDVLHTAITNMGEKNKTDKNPKIAEAVNKATKYYNSLIAKKEYFTDIQSRENHQELVDNIKTTYNNVSKQYTPKAQVAQFEDYVQFDDKGKIKGTKAHSPDKIMQDMLNNNLSQFVVIDSYTGKEIQPTIMVNGVAQPNPEYPDPSTIELASIDKEVYRDMKDGKLSGTKIGLNVSAMESKYSTMELDGMKNPKVIKGAVQRNYKVIAQGIATKTYTDAKYQQNMSNYYANPNTPTGKQSYIDAQMYKDPDYYKELSKVNAAPVGDKTLMKVNFYNTGLLKETPHIIETKKNNNGHITAVIKDHNNNNVTDELKFANVEDFNNYVQLVKESSEYNAQQARDRGYTGNPAEILKDREDEEKLLMGLFEAFSKGIDEGLASGKIKEQKISNSEGNVTIKYRTQKQLDEANKSSKDFEKNQKNKVIRTR